MKKTIVPLILSLLLYVVLSGEWFIAGKGVVFAYVADKVSGVSELDLLREKNKQLEVENMRLKSVAAISLSEEKHNSIKAKVFSSYPFSDRSQVTINIGSGNGVKEGDIVVSDNLLVGRVVKVFKNTSSVQTIFDRTFKLPVRIGKNEIDALYVGGLEPSLQMIDTKDALPCCELVVSAAADYPYGLGLGKTKSMNGELLKTAGIESILDLKTLRDVSVVIK